MSESEWEKIPSVVFGPTGEVMFDIMDGAASVACCLGEDMADALLRDHKLADLTPTLWQMLLVMANGHCEDKRLHYLLPEEPVLRCECGWAMELTDEEAVLLTLTEATNNAPATSTK